MKMKNLTIIGAAAAVSILSIACTSDPAPEPGDGDGDGMSSGGTGATVGGDGDVMSGGTTGGGTGGSGTTAPVSVSCVGATIGGGDMPVIDDFEDGDMNILDSEGRGGIWSLNADESGDTSHMVVDGDADRGRVLDVSLADFDANTWGGNLLATLGGACFDASAYDGIAFWAKGSGTASFEVRTTTITPLDLGGACDAPDCNTQNYHAVEIELRDEWSRYAFTWDKFVQKANLGVIGGFSEAELEGVSFRTADLDGFTMMLDDVQFMVDGDPGEMLNGNTGMGGSSAQ